MHTKILRSYYLLLIIILASSAVSAATKIEPFATIKVGQFPSGVAYDSGKGEIFVTNLGDGTVSVISDETNTVIATIKVGRYPRGLAYDSGKGMIYVVNSGNNSVSVISDSTNTVVATIPVGELPQSIVYDPAKGELFVANTNYDNAISSISTYVCTVSVISDETNTVVDTINVQAGPLGLVYDSARGEIFVSNELSASISVISDSDNKVVKTIDMEGNGVEGMAYVPSKGEIYVAVINAAKVSVISDKTNSVVKEIGLGDYGGNPGGVVYDSGKGQLWVSATHTLVISEKNYAVVGEVPLGLGAMAYDSGKEEIFAVKEDGNTVSVISDSFTPSESPQIAATPPVSIPKAPAASPQTPSSPVSYHSASGFPWWIVIIIVVLLLLIIRRRRRARRSKKV